MKNMAEKIPNCPVMIERPKMPKATWEALKVHIFREQVKKKQALEQTQEFERQRREREQRKKEQALTLEETKSEIARLEGELILHREGKHLLFQKLKKVIHQEQGMKDHGKSNVASHLYLQPPSRLTGMGIYPKPTAGAGQGLVGLVDRLRGPKGAVTLKRPPAPFADDPPSGEGPFKRQRQWTHEEDDGRKMTVHATLATSNFPLREPQSEGFGLVRGPSGPGSAAANLFAPAVPPLVLLRDESRMAPVLSSLATSLIPSTETAPPKDRRANAKIQPESSSSTAGLNSNPYRVSADGEKNVPSMPMVLSTLRPNMGHQWPGVNVQGFGPRPPVPEAGIPRPTTRAAPPRYGGGISYGNAFVRSFGGEGPRFGQRATERTRPLRNVTAAAPNATGFVRLREPGYQERPRQPSTASFLPPNSNNSTDSSKLSAELVTTSTPFFLPSQVDPRIYAHQREQALAHLQQQAYAAAAMANLPQHFRYDATFMPGYPTYLGIPLLGVHTNQIVEQALGRRAENYYEK